MILIFVYGHKNIAKQKKGSSSLKGIIDLPKAQKLMERIFDLGPRFGLMAQNVPKMALNLKN